MGVAVLQALATGLAVWVHDAFKSLVTSASLQGN